MIKVYVGYVIVIRTDLHFYKENFRVLLADEIALCLVEGKKFRGIIQ